ncbi:MAG: alpha-E domain-containing protein [Thiotrichales bacterium]|nr:alpha-E domain-containing protein [Thiotrichales bacterium]MCY4349568.1 alpha-E domain-containing protein [Thiotrichales bacterium]
MLSRSAQGLYWMSRYLERAAHLCRLLELQVEALVDRPASMIHFGWRRIYASQDRRPPFEDDAGLDESDDFTLADAYTLAGDLTFERSNPESIRNCLAAGRENARQMRHCISAEMWTCLNLAWLRVRDLDIEDIWKVSPESFYARTRRDIDTFVGVAEATMYRGEGWRFMQIGRFIERAQRVTTVLLAQLATGKRMPDTDPNAGLETGPETGWVALLRTWQAFDAYRQRYSVEVRPDQALDLLVADPLLPGSLARSLETLVRELAAIGPSPNAGAGAAVERLAGRLCALIRYEWPDHPDRPALLAEARAHCLHLHDLVSAAYIDYDPGEAPVR